MVLYINIIFIHNCFYIYRKRQIQVEEQLKEAAVEPKIVVVDDKFACSPPICHSVSLPVKSYLQFVSFY